MQRARVAAREASRRRVGVASRVAWWRRASRRRGRRRAAWTRRGRGARARCGAGCLRRASSRPPRRPRPRRAATTCRPGTRTRGRRGPVGDRVRCGASGARARTPPPARQRGTGRLPSRRAARVRAPATPSISAATEHEPQEAAEVAHARVHRAGRHHAAEPVQSRPLMRPIARVWSARTTARSKVASSMPSGANTRDATNCGNDVPLTTSSTRPTRSTPMSEYAYRRPTGNRSQVSPMLATCPGQSS